MSVQLNHTIVHAHDKQETARHLVEILGLPEPAAYGPFLEVKVANNVSLDVADTEGKPRSQHYAFLVSEEEFDAIHGRIQERGLPYWADPFHRLARRDQPRGRRSRALLGRPQRPRPRDPHGAVRRLGLTGPATTVIVPGGTSVNPPSVTTTGACSTSPAQSGSAATTTSSGAPSAIHRLSAVGRQPLPEQLGRVTDLGRGLAGRQGEVRVQPQPHAGAFRLASRPGPPE